MPSRAAGGGGAPRFDPARFMRVRCSAQELSRVCGSLRSLEGVLAAMSRRRRRAALGGSAAAALVVGLLWLVDEASFGIAAALVASGFLFAYVVLLGRRLLFARPGESRGMALFFLINPGIFIAAPAGMSWAALKSVRALDHPAACAIGLVLSAVVVYAVSVFFSWSRFADVSPRRLEVDYLARVVLPLLRDLPDGTRCELEFNPYAASWSRLAVPGPTRAGYTIESFADILLRVRFEPERGRAFRLEVLEYSRFKTKDRKAKWKGAKRRVVYRYGLSGGATGHAREGGRALEAHLARARASWERSQEKAGDHFPGMGDFAWPGAPAYRARVVSSEQCLRILQVVKSTSSSRDLEPTSLLPPRMVLETVRFLTGAGAIGDGATGSPPARARVSG